MSLIEDINKLEEEFADSRNIDEIRQWKTVVLEKLKIDACTKLEGVKMLIRECEDRIIGINNKLVDITDRVDEKERDKLMNRKEMYYWFVNFFHPISQEYIDEIENKVNENLNNS